jgi:hypothetical protein
MLTTAVCTVSGPPEYEEASQKWCDKGVYSHVAVDPNVEELTFTADLTLNEKGFEQYSKDPGPFWLPAGQKVFLYKVRHNADATITFWYEGEKLGHCFPGRTGVICEPYEEGKIY